MTRDTPNMSVIRTRSVYGHYIQLKKTCHLVHLPWHVSPYPGYISWKSQCINMWFKNTFIS